MQADMALGDIARLRRLVRVSAAYLYDKYQNLMKWLIYSLKYIVYYHSKALMWTAEARFA